MRRKKLSFVREFTNVLLIFSDKMILKSMGLSYVTNFKTLVNSNQILKFKQKNVVVAKLGERN